jgi:hypothetical protein
MPLVATPGAKPFSRADDVRGLRFRVRNVALSGTYAAGGVAVTAEQLGMKRVYGGISLQGSGAPLAAGTSADGLIILPNSNFTQVTVKLTESAAAGSPDAEKGAEAVDVRSVLVLFIGY